MRALWLHRLWESPSVNIGPSKIGRWRRAIDVVRRADWARTDIVLLIVMAFAVTSLSLAVQDVRFHATRGLTNALGDPVGDDFLNCWTGARLAADGRMAFAYDQERLHESEERLLGQPTRTRIYAYPPVMGLFLWPLASFSYLPALAIWSVIGAAVCAALLSRISGWLMAIGATIGAPAMYMNLHSGQNGYFTAAALVGGLLLVERRPMLSGFLFGLLCCKPQLALLLPVALLSGGHWRCAVASAATALVLIVTSLALFGSDTWIGFLHETSALSHLTDIHPDFWSRMPTIFIAVKALGGAAAAANILQAVSALAAAAIVAITWRGQAAPDVKAAILIIATFLATPYAWDYDMVATVFAAALLGREARRSGFLTWEKASIAALFLVPVAMIITMEAATLPLGPLVLWLTLAMALRRASSESHSVMGLAAERVS